MEHIVEYTAVTFLVLLSGLFSGLTIGLTGLDKFDLERKIQTGDKNAERVYSVRQYGNLLLCTLLLSNVAVNSAISILLSSVASGLIAGLIATGLIVIFGEVLPAALCSRHALAIGAKTAWLVKIIIFIFWIICKPFSMILDRILGKETPTIMSRRELKLLVDFYERSNQSKIDSDEKKILQNALSFSDKTVYDVLTPRTQVYAIEANTIFNAQLANEIKESGVTRIPVYEEKIENVIGVLLVKDLLGVEYGKEIYEYINTEKYLVFQETKRLDDALNEYIKRKTHLAIVYDKHGGFEGIVTIEDIIEEILGVEIVDETDKTADLRAEALKQATSIRQM